MTHWCWVDTPAQFDAQAAQVVAQALELNPKATVALPTGRTPEGLYAELLRRGAQGAVELGSARYFNLDEYVGLGPRDPASFAAYLQQRFLQPALVPASQVRLLRGDAADSAGECRDYDAAIAAAGGIDLAILGLGANGHIAFNEPGADWNCRTHVARLTAQTRAAGGGGSADGVPALGITMGIATLREATQVLLLVAGDSKRAALAAFGAGRALPEWPVTALIDPPRLTVVCDRSLRTPP